MNGTVIVDNDAVQLQNLSGVVQQDLPDGASTARFRVQGLDDLHNKDTSLDVTLDNVHTTEDLVKAIPEQGDNDLAHRETEGGAGRPPAGGQ